MSLGNFGIRAKKGFCMESHEIQVMICHRNNFCLALTGRSYKMLLSLLSCDPANPLDDTLLSE